MLISKPPRIDVVASPADLRLALNEGSTLKSFQLLDIAAQDRERHPWVLIDSENIWSIL